jgi:hypothetical protein
MEVLMSWSIQLVGTPEKVAEALQAHSGTLSGQCKVEYDDALPYLVGLVSNNFADGERYKPSMVKIAASGSGVVGTSPKDPEGQPQQLQRNCSVTLEGVYGTICL